jgi:hypothetical protein
LLYCDILLFRSNTNNNPVISSFIICHRVCNKSNGCHTRSMNCLPCRSTCVCSRFLFVLTRWQIMNEEMTGLLLWQTEHIRGYSWHWILRNVQPSHGDDLKTFEVMTSNLFPLAKKIWYQRIEKKRNHLQLSKFFRSVSKWFCK